MFYKKICAYCGKAFEAQKKTALYCSSECRQKTYVKKEREEAEKNAKNKPTKKCIICGKPFRPLTKKRLCCSAECSKAYDKKRMAEKAVVTGWQDLEKHRGKTEWCRWCGKLFKPFSVDNEVHRGKFFCECKCASAFTRAIEEKASGGGDYARATFFTLAERAKKNGRDYEHYRELYKAYLERNIKTQ